MPIVFWMVGARVILFSFFSFEFTKFFNDTYIINNKGGARKKVSL